MKQTFAILASMCGPRQRCMYCEDSRGVDIDHLWPKSQYPERTFVWENFILTCAGCNRAKGEFFTLDIDGHPLLIDPTCEDPWEHLFFDSQTGIITAKFHRKTGQADPRGHYTIEISGLPLNHQATTEGRIRIYRNLVRCVLRFLEIANTQSLLAEAQADLFNCVDDNSDLGLSSWFFQKEGQKEHPFSDLRRRAKRAWREIVRRLESFPGSAAHYWEENPSSIDPTGIS